MLANVRVVILVTTVMELCSSDRMDYALQAITVLLVYHYLNHMLVHTTLQMIHAPMGRYWDNLSKALGASVLLRISVHKDLLHRQHAHLDPIVIRLVKASALSVHPGTIAQRQQVAS